MHSYLRAIGFSNIKSNKQLQVILKDVLDGYDEKSIVTDKQGITFMEITKTYGSNYGITIFGEYDDNSEFEGEYYFPYFKGSDVTTNEEVIVEKHIGRESFTGACDDVRVGVTLIFYVQNAARYLREREFNGLFKETSTTFSGLSIQANILLPIFKKVKEENEKDAYRNRNSLIEAARLGDETAIENLTIEDLDTYSMISRRLMKEDVFSIIDSYFMPYGMECDQYNIMGDIKECSCIKNTYTEENIYQMRIDCNDMEFDICINEKDLVGTPQVGRRFKGVIWLQGKINFSD